MECGVFGGEVAGAVAAWMVGIGEPCAFGGVGDSDGHDARTVGALERGGELGEATEQFEVEAWGFGGEFEVGGFEVGFDEAGGFELGQFLGKKRRDLLSGERDRALE